MSTPDLPEPLRAFIRAHIADVDAVEVLLVLARNRARSFDVRSIMHELRTKNLSEAIVLRHLATFRERGLVVHLKDDEYQYYPVLPELDPLVADLARAYEERPVTIMRMIYALKGEDFPVPDTDRGG